MFEGLSKDSPVAVLGGGAVGKTCAADCVLGGNKDVRLFELPEFFDQNLKNVAKTGITLGGIQKNQYGFKRTGKAFINLLTSDIAEAVKAGGTLILECTSRETAILYWTPGEEFERAGYKVVTHFEVVGAWEGLKSQWTLYPLEKDFTGKAGKQSVIDHTLIQRLYPASFLRDKLLDFGFSSAEVYGDYDLSPYNEKARTMLFLAVK